MFIDTRTNSVDFSPLDRVAFPEVVLPQYVQLDEIESMAVNALLCSFQTRTEAELHENEKSAAAQRFEAAAQARLGQVLLELAMPTIRAEIEAYSQTNDWFILEPRSIS